MLKQQWDEKDPRLGAFVEIACTGSGTASHGPDSFYRNFSVTVEEPDTVSDEESQIDALPVSYRNRAKRSWYVSAGASDFGRALPFFLEGQGESFWSPAASYDSSTLSPKGGRQSSLSTSTRIAKWKRVIDGSTACRVKMIAKDFWRRYSVSVVDEL